MGSSSLFYWWRLKILIDPVLEESLSWKLESLGITRYAIKYRPEECSKLTLYVWLPDCDWSENDREFLIASLKPLADVFHLTLSLPNWLKLADEDWSVSWKQHWAPDPVGERILILPAWLEPPKEFLDRLILKLDPGSAFGTGSHPTTRLCLEALEKKPPLGLRVVDLGCGSGVLGLAALGLGAKEVLAVDIDSLAVSSTRKNVELNKFALGHLQASLGSVEVLGSELKSVKADLLLCNILAPVIAELAPSFDDLLCLDGRALLSGLLVDQAPKLFSRLESLGWHIDLFLEQDKWGLIEISRDGVQR